MTPTASMAPTAPADPAWHGDATSVIEFLRPLRAQLDAPGVLEVCVNRPGELLVETLRGWQTLPAPERDRLAAETTEALVSMPRGPEGSTVAVTMAVSNMVAEVITHFASSEEIRKKDLFRV